MLPLGPDGCLHRRRAARLSGLPGTRAGPGPEGSTPMTIHQPAPAPDSATMSPGERLASWGAAREAQAAAAMRLIAAGDRSNDACLHARQFLEQSLGSGQGSPL